VIFVRAGEFAVLDLFSFGYGTTEVVPFPKPLRVRLRWQFCLPLLAHRTREKWGTRVSGRHRGSCGLVDAVEMDAKEEEITQIAG
jgi:hypothetical protein